MAVYVMTPEERRARAQAVVARRNAVAEYRMATRLSRAYAMEAEETKLVQPKKKKDDANWFLRGLSTVGDVVANVVEGAVKGLEGIVDLGIGLVGGVGGIFNGDFQKTMKDAVAYDFTGEIIGQPIQDALKYSYLEDGGIVENVANGVGQILPAVLVAVFTAGAGTAAQVASLAASAASAAGTSAESAYREGANYYAGLGYGVASGLVEAGTEKMFGGATKGVFGAGAFDGVVKSLGSEVAETGAKRVIKSTVKNAVEEGVEEIASELAQPTLKTIYKGADSIKEYGEGEYWKGVGQAGLVGALTSAAYSGTIGYGISNIRVGSKKIGATGKAADIEASITANESIKRKLQNLEDGGGLTEQAELAAADSTRKNWQNIENTLKSVSPDKRAALIKDFSLHEAFNADGTMSEQLSSLLNASESGESSFNREFYSVRSRGSEDKINNDLAEIREDLIAKYAKENDITAETVAEKLAELKVQSSELSSEGQKNFVKMKKALRALNGEKGNLSFVVVEANDAFEGALKGDDTLYIGADTLENGSWVDTLIHEYTHFAEGSREYMKLYDFLMRGNITVDDGSGGRISLYEKAQNAVLSKGYGIDKAQLDAIIDKRSRGEELTSQELLAYDVFTSEVTAHQTGMLFGNEEFIDRLVARDAPLAKRLIERIIDLKNVFKRLGMTTSSKEYRLLHKAERLYLAAARKAGNRSLANFILSKDPELEEEKKTEETRNTRYAIKFLSEDDLSGYLRAGERSNNYKHQALNRGKKIILTSSEEIRAYIEKAIAGEKDLPTVAYGKVDVKLSEETADYSDGNIQIANFYLELVANDIRHAYQEHLHAKEKGDIDLSIEDFVNIPLYVATYDDFVYATKYKSGNTKICLSKKISDGRVLVIETVSKSHGSIEFKNMIGVSEEKYLEEYEKRYKKENSTNARGSESSNNSLRDETVSSTSIPESEQKSNTFGKISSENQGADVSYNLKANSSEDITSIKEENMHVTAESNEKFEWLALNDERLMLSEKAAEQAETYQKRIDTWDGKTEGFAFIMGDTPAYLSEIEVSGKKIGKKQIRIDATKIKSIMKGHPEMTIDVIKQLPSLLNTPILVLDSKTVSGRLVLLGEVYANSMPVMMALEINPSTRSGSSSYVDIMKIASAYVRSNTQNLISTSNIRYINENKNRVNDWLKVNRLQLPLPNSQSNSVISSIPESEQKSNTLSKNSSKKSLKNLDKSDTSFNLKTQTEIDADELLKGKSAGEIKKVLADNTRMRVYSKAEAAKVVDEIAAKITPEMNEKERYEALKVRDLENIPAATEISDSIIEKIPEISSWEDLDKYFGHGKRTLIRKIATEFGVIGAEYFNGDIQLSFEFSANNFRESYSKQGRNFKSFAKMLSVFDEIVENAVGVEAHNRTDYKPDPTLDTVFVLISAYQDGEFIVPVKLEVKKFKDKQNSLYVAISLDKIKKTEVWKQGDTENGVTRNSRSVNISIAKIFEKINTSDKSFLKYIPDGFLTDEQKQAKNEALSKDADMAHLISNDNTARFNLKTQTEIDADELLKGKSAGEIKKVLADNTRMRVYSKAEAAKVVDEIIANNLVFDTSLGTLRGKSKAQVIDMLWQSLNSVSKDKQRKVAKTLADYIIEHANVSEALDAEDMEAPRYTLEHLGPYLHSLDLSDESLRAEIRRRYGYKNPVHLMWGKKDGIKVDVAVMEIEELGFNIEAENIPDMLAEIHDKYTKASDAIKESIRKRNEPATENASDESIEAAKQAVADKILATFKKGGKISKLADAISETWKGRFYEERQKNKTINSILEKVKFFTNDKTKAFLNASQFKSGVFKQTIDSLSRIKYRGNINKSGTKDILEGLADWYTKENPLLKEGIFNEEIEQVLRYFSYVEGELSASDLALLEQVVDHFKHLVENYNKVLKDGKWVDAEPLVKRYVNELQKNQNYRPGMLRRFFESYLRFFGEPMTVARYMDGYDSGFYTETMEDLRRGAVGAAVMEMDIRQPLDAFYKGHKHFSKQLERKTVTFEGYELTLGHAISLYMSLHRDQAVAGLAESGYMYVDKYGKHIRRNGGMPSVEKLTEIDYALYRNQAIDELKKQFDADEREYIKILEKIFNEDCKSAKAQTDEQRLGFSNILEGYYFPIRRAYTATNIERSYTDEMYSISRASFNKSVKEKAKNELYLEPVNVVVGRHIRGVSQYANLAEVIDRFNVLYNLDTNGKPNKVVSVKTEGVNVWREGEDYIRAIINDIQGKGGGRGLGSRLLGKIRSSYAKFQLGANPKVWLTQMSSLLAATSILDYGSVVKGFGISGKDVDEYCALARLRNNDNTAALAQGIIDKTGKVGDLTMKPIGKVDRFVVRKLFAACQAQVQKDSGLKIGTEENKVKAGELLTKVILETQQNSLATERSAAMRSNSEILKTLVMFTSDAMKVVCRVIDSFGEVAVLHKKLHAATNPEEIARLKGLIKQANKKAGKAVASLVATSVFMALVAQLFRWAYAKDDEDEWVENMTVDSVGNLIGGLPIFKDIYAKFTDGYDLDNYAYSTFNDLVDSAKAIFSATGNVFSGNADQREALKSVKDIIYAGGQLFGIPTRNVYNMVYGITKRVSPSTAYKFDNVFYKQNYRSDLAKAIKNDDEDMIATITGLMLDENVGEMNSAARAAMDKLISAGYDVIPRSVGDSVTYEGESYRLTSAERDKFKSIYSVANKTLAELVSLPQYSEATDEVKVSAIKLLYNIYYNLALQDYLGVDLETKTVLFAEAIDIDKLVIIVATARSMTSDTDSTGKTVNGSKKAKIQRYVNGLKLSVAEKYMIMGYLGYTNINGESQVKAYINRLKLTTSEKKKLLEYSGYKV